MGNLQNATFPLVCLKYPLWHLTVLHPANDPDNCYCYTLRHVTLTETQKIIHSLFPEWFRVLSTNQWHKQHHEQQSFEKLKLKIFFLSKSELLTECLPNSSFRSSTLFFVLVWFNFSPVIVSRPNRIDWNVSFLTNFYFCRTWVAWRICLPVKSPHRRSVILPKQKCMKATRRWRKSKRSTR